MKAATRDKAELLTPDQERAAYNDIPPIEVARLIGCRSAAHVCRLIRMGELDATNIGTGKIARYVVSREAIADFKRRRRVHGSKA